MRRRKPKKAKLWFAKGPSNTRASRGRWARLRANHTEGELRSMFADYPGSKKK